MNQVTYHGKDLLAGPQDFFKLCTGPEPSFGFFRTTKATVEYVLDTKAGAGGDLVFTGALDANGLPITVTLKNIYLVKATSIGGITDEVYDIVLADERILWQYAPGDASYNTYPSCLNFIAEKTITWDATDEKGNDYILENLNGAAEWTFEQVFNAVFTLLGITPTFHWEPAGAPAQPLRFPRNIVGKNVPVPDILEQVLTEANCFLAFDPTASPSACDIYPLNAASRPADLTLFTTYTGLLHDQKTVRLNTKVSLPATVKMGVHTHETTKIGTAGSQSISGGTGTHVIPSPYAEYESSDYLTYIGNEVATEFKNSWQNEWGSSEFAGVLPFVLNRAVHVILWQSNAKGAKTLVRSFRPYEMVDRQKRVFSHGRYWVGDWYVAIGIYKVLDELAVPVDGVYLCNKQTAAGGWSATEHEVLNLIENDTVAAYTPALAKNDRIMAWESKDAAGAVKLVGIPVTSSVRRCKTTQPAPNSKQITCNLYANDGVTEITGADLGAGIPVDCATTEAANLNATLPRLKSEQDIFAGNLSGRWWCTTVFQASKNCICTT